MSNPKSIGDAIAEFGKLVNEFQNKVTGVKPDKEDPKAEVRLFENATSSKFTIIVEYDGRVTPEFLDEMGLKAFSAVKEIVAPKPKD